MKTDSLSINGRIIGAGHPVYIVAEISANHNQDFDRAIRIIQSAKDAGADAIKLQTYTPDTITLNVKNRYFNVTGTIWEGKNLYDLYGEAYTPWEWQPRLKEIAESLGLHFFSSPFDPTAVGFLEKMKVPAYKIASFEVVDIPLIQQIASTGKPIIMSTGMATLAEIDEAIQAIRRAGGNQIALLKCTSAYPSPPEEMNLKTIPHLADAFCVPVGISDHSLGFEVAIAAVALGACIVEKHLTLSRETQGPDSPFSMEPHEFKQMVEAIRTVENALGKISYEITEAQKVSRIYRRSLFVVADMAVGDIFSDKNIRSIRPAYGLHPRYFGTIMGRRATKNLKKGTPLDWGVVG